MEGEGKLLTNLVEQLPVAAAMLLVVWFMLKWAKGEVSEQRAAFMEAMKDHKAEEALLREQLINLQKETNAVLRENAVMLERFVEKNERLEDAIKQCRAVT